MKQRGFTIIELMVTTMVTAVIGGVFVYLLQIGTRMQDVVIGQSNAFLQARKGIDLMADHLRNAQCDTNSGSGTLNSVIDAGAINDITYYGDSTPTLVRYRLNGTTIQRTMSGVTTNVATDISALELTYYKLSSYNGSWATTSNSHAPTAAELLLLAGVEIKVTVAKDGYTTQYKTIVRFRNSPKKSRLVG